MAEQFLHALKYTRKHKRLCALHRREICVARTHRQTIRFACDGADCDSHGHIKVTHHAFDDGTLGSVLLSEVGDIRLDDVEEFADDGGATAKVSGAKAATETLAQTTYFDKCSRTIWIHLIYSGSEEQVHTFLLQHGSITFERARILRVILIRPELSGVYKDGSRYNIAFFFRSV